MIRRALIIECSNIPGYDRLPGAITDANNWNYYLPSNKAGAWDQAEIVTLHNPTCLQVQAEIRKMSSGYGFVAFSGHGCVRNGDTHLRMYDGELTEYQLTPTAQRATVILDSCRGDRTAELSESMEARSAALKAETPRQLYRNLFDDALSRVEEGPIRIYGCSFNQAAQETRPENGGDFTHEFIKAGTQSSVRIFTVRDAYGVACERLSKKGTQQRPEYKPGRRISHFPFAVKF